MERVATLRRVRHLAADVRREGPANGYADGVVAGLGLAVDILSGLDPVDAIDQILKEDA
jgi:hypothetical protein